MNYKKMVEFTKVILRQYNATPDEWDHFERICDLHDEEEVLETKPIMKTKKNVNIDPVTGIHYGVIPHSNLKPEVLVRLHDKAFGAYSSSAIYKVCWESVEDMDGTEFEFEGATFIWFSDVVMVKKSGTIGTFSECSPCCPNAGDLTERNFNGIPTYELPYSNWELVQNKVKRFVFNLELSGEGETAEEAWNGIRDQIKMDIGYLPELPENYVDEECE
jgi:hypothetical protein